MPVTRKPSARATLEKRPAKLLRQVAGLEDAAQLPAILGPRVATRHTLAAYRKAAKALVAEKEEASARRRGERVLSEAEMAALRVAGSRLLGLDGEVSPLTRASDEALDRFRTEREPEVLAGLLAELDPEGNWGEAPATVLLTGMVLVATSAEGDRRWRIREAENQARIRERRGPVEEAGS